MRKLLAAACLLLASQAGAARVDYNSMIPALKAHDARLLAIGWRMARANAALCRDAVPSAGLMLVDLAELDRPAEARAVMGIGGNLAVIAVARAGPAERAGIAAGEQLVAVDGSQPVDLDGAYARIEAGMAAHGRVMLTLAAPRSTARSIVLTGEKACRGEFELLVGRKAAMTDGKRIAISVELLAERPLDEEAAFMAGHELAHIALNHRRRLDEGTRNYVTVRRTEREADRLAPWLMANAGYDPAAAARFVAWWGPRYSGGITRRPDHDAWPERLALIEAEVAKVRAARAAQPEGLLDWRGQFSLSEMRQ